MQTEDTPKENGNGEEARRAILDLADHVTSVFIGKLMVKKKIKLESNKVTHILFDANIRHAEGEGRRGLTARRWEERFSISPIMLHALEEEAAMMAAS